MGDETAILHVNRGEVRAESGVRKKHRWWARSSGLGFWQREIPACAVRRSETASVIGIEALVGFRGEVKPLIHKGQQLLPTDKVEITRQRAQVVEKGAASSQFAAYGLIHPTTERQDTVEEKGQ